MSTLVIGVGDVIGRTPARPRRRSLGQTILVRTLAERRKLTRKLVVGSDRPGLGVIVLRAPAAAAPAEADADAAAEPDPA